jgi:hypothetical protein
VAGMICRAPPPSTTPASPFDLMTPPSLIAIHHYLYRHYHLSMNCSSTVAAGLQRFFSVSNFASPTCALKGCVLAFHAALGFVTDLSPDCAGWYRVHHRRCWKPLQLYHCQFLSALILSIVVAVGLLCGLPTTLWKEATLSPSCSVIVANVAVSIFFRQ